MTTCSCPGCSEPGLYSCSFCQSSLYCSIACQKKDWLSHKETCEGHLLKQGLTHLQKARELGQDGDCEESLRYNNLALTVLNRLKDRPIEILSDALELKCDTLSTMGQHKQALESAKERYTTTMARKRAPLDSKMGELSQSTTSTTTEEDKLILLQRQIESLRCELLDNENQLVELQRVHDEDLAKQIAVFEAACEEKATKIRDLEEKCRLHEEEGCRRKEQLLAMDDDKKEMQASLVMLQHEVLKRIDETEKLQTMLDEATANSVDLQAKINEMKDKQEMAEHVKQFIMQELADVSVNTTPKTPKTMQTPKKSPGAVDGR